MKQNSHLDEESKKMNEIKNTTEEKLKTFNETINARHEAFKVAAKKIYMKIKQAIKESQEMKKKNEEIE